MSRTPAPMTRYPSQKREPAFAFVLSARKANCDYPETINNPIAENEMPIPEDLSLIATQEKELTFTTFDFDTAWSIGLLLRDLAVSRKVPAVVDIRRFGQPHQPLFYTALPGSTPDNSRWVQRKSNVVARFHRSSYAVGLNLQHNNTTFPEKYALADADYAPHGGSFPIHVIGTGVVGAITVSGLPQREDHNLAVEALCRHLGRDHAKLRLPPL